MNTKTTQAASTQVNVWDPLVRIFHWSLVIAFSVAYLSGEDSDEGLNLHVWAGYTVLGLVLFRLAWGLVGTRYARFTDFIYRPATVWQYLRDVIARRAKRYLGHNPLGGAMIVALLVSLSAATVSGLALYAQKENAGPLAGLVATTADAPATAGLSPQRAREHRHDDGEDREGDGALKEAHEFFSNLTLLLVFLHIGGVLLSSIMHRENLVRAMFTGRKRADSDTGH